MQITKLLISNLFILTLFFLNSCDKKPMFEENKLIKNNQWQLSDTISFDINVTDTVNFKNLSLNIRNSSAYPYYNMFVMFDIKNDQGFAQKDTFEFYLADPITGKWTGSGSSGIYYNTILCKKAKFPNLGNYEVSLTHAMRDTVLEGVNAIGFKVN